MCAKHIDQRLAGRGVGIMIRKLVPFLFPLMFLTGCGSGSLFTRTIYTPHGTPVRLRETVPDVKVWVKDADGEVVPGEMDLPEGWYALPIDNDEE
jgi:hypothetical protein